VSHHWSPLSQLRSVPFLPQGEQQWEMFDRHTVIALIRPVVLGRQRVKLYRAVTYDTDPMKRRSICYTPHA